VIPYDMESMRAMKARDQEARRFASLEFGPESREWAAAKAGEARRRPKGRWTAAVVAFLWPR
jgi:hypothetical protein